MVRVPLPIHDLFTSCCRRRLIVHHEAQPGWLDDWLVQLMLETWTRTWCFLISKETTANQVHSQQAFPKSVLHLMHVMVFLRVVTCLAGCFVSTKICFVTFSFVGLHQAHA